MANPVRCALSYQLEAHQRRPTPLSRFCSIFSQLLQLFPRTEFQHAVAQTKAEIWNRPGGFAYNRQFDPQRLEGRCVPCDKAAECRGGCRGYNYFMTGSPYGWLVDSFEQLKK